MRAHILLAALPALAVLTTSTVAAPAAPAGSPEAPKIVVRALQSAGSPAAETVQKPASAAPAPAAALPAKALAPNVPEAAASTTAAAAPAKTKPAAPKTTLIARIDLSAQRMEVEYGGGVRHSWQISSGAAGYETPRGSFHPKWTSKMWYSRKYDGAPMPHSVFFNGGVAVHGTQSIGMLGQPASHGCVRLAPANASQFYKLVQAHGLKSTRIRVYGSTPVSRIARRTPSQAGQRVVRRQPVRPAQPSWPLFNGWSQPIASATPARSPSVVRRAPPGIIQGPQRRIIHVPRNSPYAGQASFVMNGVRYVRIH